MGQEKATVTKFKRKLEQFRERDQKAYDLLKYVITLDTVAMLIVAGFLGKLSKQPNLHLVSWSLSLFFFSILVAIQGILGCMRMDVLSHSLIDLYDEALESLQSGVGEKVEGGVGDDAFKKAFDVYAGYVRMMLYALGIGVFLFMVGLALVTLVLQVSLK